MAQRRNKESAPSSEQRAAAKWKKAIGEALRVEKDWRESATKVVRRYRAEDREDAEAALGPEECGSRFNILYANLAVLKPAIFQNAPRPDVRRRYEPEGNDEKAKALREVASNAANVLERALSYQIDEWGFEEEALEFVDDGLLPGRGVLRVRYKPELTEEPVTDPVTGEPVFDEKGKPAMSERIIGQSVWGEHVYWKNFLTAPYRKWTKTDRPPWIAFLHLMTRADLIDNFGKEKAMGVPLNWSPDTGESKDKALGEGDRAQVWEVWDARERKVHWVAMGHSALIDSVDDPLGLSDFFPCPKPFYSIRTTDTLVPIAEYRMYADQANELDDITSRISVLTRELKVKGLYDASVPAVKQLIEAGDSEMIPIDDFQATQGRKVEDLIAFWPLEKIIQALAQLHIQREQVKQTIFEIMGISDILRGSSNPNETLGAQRIKTQFGTLRIDERRREVNRILRDALRLMAEIIAEKFEPDVLITMTGVQVDKQVMNVLRNEGLRGFLVDIESDSTVAPDEMAEQEAVTKLLTGVTQFIEGVAPMVQQGLLTGEQALALLRFAVRPFRGARNLEQILDEAERSLAEAAEQPEPPSPEELAQKAEAEKRQFETQKAATEAQSAEQQRAHEDRMQKYELVKALLAQGQGAQE